MSQHKFLVSAILSSLFLALPPQSRCDQSPALSISGGVENFRWRELDGGGGRLLEESGPRYNVAVNYDNLRRLNSGAVYSVGGKFYVGAVDYDGQTQLTGVPMKSTTHYTGVQLDGLGGYRFARRLRGLDLLGGVGLDFWLRSIDDTYVQGVGYVYGGDEDYFAFNAKLGLGYFQELGRARHYLQAGLKYPFYVYEYGYPVAADDVTLHPKGRASLFAKYQWEFGSTTRDRWGVTLYYDSYRLSASDPVIETANGAPTGYIVWQPESHQDVYGLQASFYFR